MLSNLPMQFLGLAFGAFIATALAIRAFVPIAHRLGLVDLPSGRKIHQQAIPLVGGLAIFAGVNMALLVSGLPLAEYRLLVAGAGTLLVIGLLDDLHEISASLRFAIQIGVVLVVAANGNMLLQSFGNLLGLGAVDLGMFAWILTPFCATGVINAVNMSDGIDGLAPGIVAIVISSILFIALFAGLEQLAPLALLISAIGSLTAFLLINVSRRIGGRFKNFLGDSGSTMLGFLLAWLLITYSQEGKQLFAPVTALWLLGLPLMDTVFVMLRRMRNGNSPFSAGQDHLHHLFLRSGRSPRVTLLCMYGLALMLAVAGVVAELVSVSESLRFYGFLAACGIYAAVIGNSWRRQRWLGRPVASKVQLTT